MGSLAVAKLLNQSSELSETARTVNSVILKPYTETVVRVSLPKAYRGADAVVLEPMIRRKSAVLDSASCGSSDRANYCL